MPGPAASSVCTTNPAETAGLLTKVLASSGQCNKKPARGFTGRVWQAFAAPPDGLFVALGLFFDAMRLFLGVVDLVAGMGVTRCIGDIGRRDGGYGEGERNNKIFHLGISMRKEGGFNASEINTKFLSID
jgi:hypothetical protein